MAKDRGETALWWVRRDLRLADNQALNRALMSASEVVPVFVLDPALLSSDYVGSKRLGFLFTGLRRLDADLQERGSRLLVRYGSPVEALGQLVDEAGAEMVFAEADYSPYARQRDSAVARHLPLRLVEGLTVHPPGAVLKDDGTPYQIFAPFKRKWRALPAPPTQSVLPIPAEIKSPDGLASETIPTEPSLTPAVAYRPGEGEASRRLRSFIDGENAPIYHYGELRDRLDLSATSLLSPYLRFGMVSARQAVVSAQVAIEAAANAGARAGAETWLDELIWREFYITILAYHPEVLETSFRPELRDIAWSNDEEAFRSWCDGRTGYPVVDAAMRQLKETGSMPNRARMIVASFLVKDLLIDWRRGERWFMEHLVDGDPAANNGGWQWTAGTGTDAAPYFRIFNPVTQAKKHDPDGDYVRRWVAELADVPAKAIHEPWKMDTKTQQAAGCIIGRDYPAPIVDHARARERVLEAYSMARSSGGEGRG